MSRNKLFSALFPSIAAIAALVPGTSSALDRTTAITPAAGICQVADASYAASFKARALSADNTGGGTIFVTCGPTSTKEVASPSFKVALRNLSTTQSVNITCTTVTGTTSTPPVYYSKTISLAAAAEGQIEWTAAGDAGSFGFPVPVSVTCALPSQTGIMNLELVTMTPIS